MHQLAQPLIGGPAQDVHAHRCGEGGHGTVGAAEGGRHNAQGEAHQSRLPQIASAAEGGQERVTLRQGSGQGGVVGGHQDAQAQEQQVHGQVAQSVHAHVELALTQGAAGEVLLHGVLIESRHHHHHKDATEKLFPEVVLAGRVVPFKHLAHGALCNQAGHAVDMEPHLRGQLADDEHEGREQYEGLHAVAPHDGAYAAPLGVAPHQQE